MAIGVTSGHGRSDDEIFLVRLRVTRRDIWLAWVAVPAGSDHYWVAEGNLLWSHTRQALVAYFEAHQRAIQPEDSYFDVDALIDGLRSGVLLDPDLGINVWNAFGDLQKSLVAGSDSTFRGDLAAKTLYGKLFSLCEGGAIAGLQPAVFSREDVELLCEILVQGRALVESHTSRAWTLFETGYVLQELGRHDAAFEFYIQAARSGVLEAQVCVANFYVDGSGVGRDLRAAADWYKRAAQRGLPEAAYNLALLHRDQGRHRWYRHWLAKAAAMGDEDAACELADA